MTSNKGDFKENTWYIWTGKAGKHPAQTQDLRISRVDGKSKKSRAVLSWTKEMSFS